jgi:hypothetical protein
MSLGRAFARRQVEWWRRAWTRTELAAKPVRRILFAIGFQSREMRLDAVRFDFQAANIPPHGLESLLAPLEFWRARGHREKHIQAWFF